MQWYHDYLLVHSPCNSDTDQDSVLYSCTVNSIIWELPCLAKEMNTRVCVCDADQNHRGHQREEEDSHSGPWSRWQHSLLLHTLPQNIGPPATAGEQYYTIERPVTHCTHVSYSYSLWLHQTLMHALL